MAVGKMKTSKVHRNPDFPENFNSWDQKSPRVIQTRNSGVWAIFNGTAVRLGASSAPQPEKAS
jgi:hypothetical protein